MKCQYCENDVPAGVTMCPACGAPAPVSELPSVPVPPAPQYAQQPGQPQIIINNVGAPQVLLSEKSRITYILLGFFLGSLGVHNFYAGYSGRAITQLLLTVLTCGAASVISAIWAIIEICVIDKSANGLPMT